MPTPGADTRRRPRRRPLLALGLAAAVVVSGCSGDVTDSRAAVAVTTISPVTPSGPSSAPSTAPTTSPPPTTVAVTTTRPTLVPASTIVIGTTTTSTTSTSTSTTTTTTSPDTVPHTTAAAGSGVPEIVPIDPATIPVDTEVEIGRSVEGRPITVVRRGDPTGTRVLVIGAIHGNEAAGVAVVDALRTAPLPPGVELWLVRSMNPDGQAIGDRQNANGVDLNRNFPVDWDVLAEPGDWQYGGPGPASEPETRAVVALGDGVRPDLVVWYHQDLFRLAPANGRRGEIRQRYSELTGIPIVPITGGTYTGTAADWVRTVIRGEGETITVELGDTLPAADVPLHVNAVLTTATEFW